MKEVAAAAGVSVMAVSRALRNEPRIAPATRDKILRVAGELGYRPNPLVGALMSELRRAGKRGSVGQTIAFLTSHAEADGWKRHPAPLAMFSGACERAEKLGFKLEPVWALEPKVTSTRLGKILRARGIRGLIVAPSPVPPVGPVSLDWDNFASVALGYSVREPKLHRVTNHHLESMRLALAELTRRGYRRIGLAVAAFHDNRVMNYWATGFLHYQSNVPDRDRVPLFIPNRLVRREFDEWLNCHHPEVVIGTIGLNWLQGRKNQAGKPVGLVSLDYYPEYGDVTGIDQNNAAVGAAAVDVVVEQLFHNERGIPELPRVVMVEGRWLDGGGV